MKGDYDPVLDQWCINDGRNAGMKHIAVAWFAAGVSAASAFFSVLAVAIKMGWLP